MIALTRPYLTNLTSSSTQQISPLPQTLSALITTMSWFARSIANTLSLNDDEEEAPLSETNPNQNDQHQNNDTSSSSSPPRGVKEDLSELTKSLTRQLWGVASFLAPPPESVPREHDESDPDDSDSVGIAGIRSDFAEIRGKLKTGISKLSDNINVSEITKMASNILQLGEGEGDDEGEGFNSAAIGVSEQVVAFAKDIAMHPETWLDFPLPEEEDDEDFNMSYAQQEHALAVERLAPALAALRIELCPGYMSEREFWKIYFVLLHPRLDKEDALLLSTPQIMEARAFLSEELQKQKRATLDDKPGEVTIPSKSSTSSQNKESLSVLSSDPPADVLQTTLALESASSTASANSETEQHQISSITAPANSETEKHQTSSTTACAISETEKHQTSSTTACANSETEKHQISSTEIPIVDNSVSEEQINQNKDQNVHSASHNAWETQDEDDADDWLKEETSEIVGASGTTIPIENEEDVSFSDLEEDDGDEPTSFNKASSYKSDKDSQDWVELKSSADSSKDIKSVAGVAKVNSQNPDTKESNDWLDVDDIDVV